MNTQRRKDNRKLAAVIAGLAGLFLVLTVHPFEGRSASDVSIGYGVTLVFALLSIHFAIYGRE